MVTNDSKKRDLLAKFRKEVRESLGTAAAEEFADENVWKEHIWVI
jgi:hypothetical protein